MIGNPDIENQLDTEEALEKSKKPRMIAAPLKNDIGEQNSFVNVIIHLLHYTTEIPEFLQKNNFKIEPQYNLLYLLQQLLIKYSKLTNPDEYSKIPEGERICDVYDLRKELEKMYKGEEMFKMNTTGDPADLLFIFLNAFHSYCMRAHSLKYSIDKECLPQHCPSHDFIWVNLVQQYECASCKSTSDVMKFDYNYFMYELQMKELLQKIQKLKKLVEFQNKFFIFSKDIKSRANGQCPKKCKNPNLKKNTILMTIKEYLFFNVSWKETTPNLSDICKFFFLIPQAMKNNEIFQIYVKDQVKPYTLYGLICYWAGHYVAFFKSLEKEAGRVNWIYHEDKTVTELKSWRDVIVLCLKNHFHPVMLFYKQSESRMSFYEDSSALNERDYLNMFRHCQRVDKANHLSVDTDSTEVDKQKPPESPSKIRPNIEVKKTNDINLVKTIKNLQKIEEIKKTGGNNEFADFMDSMEEEEEKEEEKAPSPKSPKKRGSILLGLRPGEWQCRNKACGNINNCSTYQCVKCKSINLKVYEAIQMNKQLKSSVRISTDSSAVKYEMLNKHYNAMNISIKPTQTIKKEENKDIEESDDEDNKKPKSNRVPIKTERSEEDEVNLDERYWKCPHCNFQNEENKGGFCEKCKRNKPSLHDTTIVNTYASSTERNIPMINGIKHYL